MFLQAIKTLSTVAMPELCGGLRLSAHPCQLQDLWPRPPYCTPYAMNDDAIWLDATLRYYASPYSADPGDLSSRIIYPQETPFHWSSFFLDYAGHSTKYGHVTSEDAPLTGNCIQMFRRQNGAELRSLRKQLAVAVEEPEGDLWPSDYHKDRTPITAI
jgi:hypothetical protein